MLPNLGYRTSVCSKFEVTALHIALPIRCGSRVSDLGVVCNCVNNLEIDGGIGMSIDGLDHKLHDDKFSYRALSTNSVEYKLARICGTKTFLGFQGSCVPVWSLGGVGHAQVFFLRSMLAVPYFEKALYELPEERVTPAELQALADDVERKIQGGLAGRYISGALKVDC